MPAMDSGRGDEGGERRSARQPRRRAATTIRIDLHDGESGSAEQSRAGPRHGAGVTLPGPNTASEMLPNPISRATAAQTPR